MDNFEKYINELNLVYDSKKPFVVFKKPNEFKLTTYLQNTSELIQLSNFEEKGFVFVPFKNGKKVIFPFDKSNIKSINFKQEDIFVINNALKNSIQINQKEEKKHIQLVQKAINFIKNGKADKIVLSRKEIISIEGFNLFNSFKKMLSKYPNAFVYIWFHPKIGLWMGATPEKLLSVNGNEVSTMALAGTQIYKNTIDVIWKQKEKKEQQFVSDFIIKNIKPFVKNVKVSNPYSLKAGNLLHICTKISAKLSSNNNLEKLIFSLHPTPAVCGLPKNIATQFILENENYNRDYYTGFLGELNIQNKSNLFVNLRCMQLKEDKIYIYVGGGITSDSNAKKEWEETKNKAVVIKSIL